MINKRALIRRMAPFLIASQIASPGLSCTLNSKDYSPSINPPVAYTIQATQEQIGSKKSLEEVLGKENVVRLSTDKPIVYYTDRHSGFRNYQRVRQNESLDVRTARGDVYVIDGGDVCGAERLNERGLDRVQIDDDIRTSNSNTIRLRGNHDYETCRSFERRREVQGENSGLIDLFKKFSKKFGFWNAVKYSIHEKAHSSKGLTKQQYDYLNNLPIAVIVNDELVFTHGSGISRKNYDDQDAAIYEALWRRAGNPREFLEDFGGKIMFNGHTAPWHVIPSNAGKAFRGKAKYDSGRGMGVIYDDQGNVSRVVMEPFKRGFLGFLGTPKGLFGGGGGTYLEIDPLKDYHRIEDFELGQEVRKS